MLSAGTRLGWPPATRKRWCARSRLTGTSAGRWAPRDTRRGTAELRSFFDRCFSAGGGVGLEYCAVTDDGTRCALEYNCVRWGRRDLPPQAGIGVYERGPDGLLAAVRVYDDVEAPA